MDDLGNCPTDVLVFNNYLGLVPILHGIPSAVNVAEDN